jgi:hypothetical protein
VKKTSKTKNEQKSRVSICKYSLGLKLGAPGCDTDVGEFYDSSYQLDPIQILMMIGPVCVHRRNHFQTRSNITKSDDILLRVFAVIITLKPHTSDFYLKVFVFFCLFLGRLFFYSFSFFFNGFQCTGAL